MRTAGLIALGAVLCLFVLVGTGHVRPPAEQQARWRAEAAAGQPSGWGQARLAEWATVKREKDLGGGRRVLWITMPSPAVPDDELFDINCIAFEAPGGAGIVCPGAGQGSFGGL